MGTRAQSGPGSARRPAPARIATESAAPHRHRRHGRRCGAPRTACSGRTRRDQGAGRALRRRRRSAHAPLQARGARGRAAVGPPARGHDLRRRRACEVDARRDPRSAFIVMEYLAGGTVADALRVGAVTRQRGGALAPRGRRGARPRPRPRGRAPRHQARQPAARPRAACCTSPTSGSPGSPPRTRSPATGSCSAPPPTCRPSRRSGASRHRRQRPLRAGRRRLRAARRASARSPAEHFAAQARQHIEDEPAPPASREPDAAARRRRRARPRDGQGPRRALRDRAGVRRRARGALSQPSGRAAARTAPRARCGRSRRRPAPHRPMRRRPTLSAAGAAAMAGAEAGPSADARPSAGSAPPARHGAARPRDPVRRASPRVTPPPASRRRSRRPARPPSGKPTRAAAFRPARSRWPRWLPPPWASASPPAPATTARPASGHVAAGQAPRAPRPAGQARRQAQAGPTARPSPSPSPSPRRPRPPPRPRPSRTGDRHLGRADDAAADGRDARRPRPRADAERRLHRGDPGAAPGAGGGRRRAASPTPTRCTTSAARCGWPGTQGRGVVLYQRLKIPNQTETVRLELQQALRALGQQSVQQRRRACRPAPGTSGSPGHPGAGYRATVAATARATSGGAGASRGCPRHDGHHEATGRPQSTDRGSEHRGAERRPPRQRSAFANPAGAAPRRTARP